MAIRNDNRPYDERDVLAVTAAGHLDDAQGIYFARELEYIRERMNKVPTVPMSAFRIFPISYEIPEGAVSHTYRYWDEVGSAKIIANYAMDLPRADVTGKEVTYPIRGIGNSYGYSFQELRSSQMENKGLDAKRASAADRAQRTLMNKLAFYGDAESGLPGFFTNPNIPEVVLPADGTGGSTKFEDKTSAQVIRDIVNVVTQVRKQSKTVHNATVCLMPDTTLTYIKVTERNEQSDKTLFDWVQGVLPGVQFIGILELEDAGAGGVKRMYAYEASSDNFELNIPMDVRHHTPQVKGLETVVPVESRFAGVTVQYPLAFVYADGV